MIKFVFTKIRNIVLSRFYTHAKVIVYQYRDKKNISAPLVLEKVTTENLNDALRFEDNYSFSINKKNALAEDDGYYGYFDGRCVFRAWVTKGAKAAPFHKFYLRKLAANEVYMHSCYTDAACRGKGFYSFAIAEIAEKYVAEGKTVLISTTQNNSASIKGIIKAGFIQILEINVRVLLGIKNITIHGQQN